DVLAAAVLVPAPRRLGAGRDRRVYVEMAVVDVDVPAEDVADERQRRGVVDELEEGVVEPEEREPVQRVAVRGLRAPHALDGRRQTRDRGRVERVLDGDEAVALEPFAEHVGFYGRRQV